MWARSSGAIRRTGPAEHVGWWGRLDSNQGRHSQRVYSPSPLATRAHSRKKRNPSALFKLLACRKAGEYYCRPTRVSTLCHATGCVHPDPRSYEHPCVHPGRSPEPRARPLSGQAGATTCVHGSSPRQESARLGPRVARPLAAGSLGRVVAATKEAAKARRSRRAHAKADGVCSSWPCVVSFAGDRLRVHAAVGTTGCCRCRGTDATVRGTSVDPAASGRANRRDTRCRVDSTRRSTNVVGGAHPTGFWGLRCAHQKLIGARRVGLKPP